MQGAQPYTQNFRGPHLVAGFQENEDDIITSINITPLVDIMLVLLILFMLVSTITDFNSIDVELPQAATGKEARGSAPRFRTGHPPTHLDRGDPMNVVETIEREQLKSNIPAFKAGDTVRVHVRVIEGEKERIQVFEGVVLRRSRGGNRASFTVQVQF